MPDSHQHSTPSAPFRRLGRSDLCVSPIAMGCWAIVRDSTWGLQDEKDSLDALRCFGLNPDMWQSGSRYW